MYHIEYQGWCAAQLSDPIEQLFFVFKSEYGAMYGAIYPVLAIRMTVYNPYSSYG